MSNPKKAFSKDYLSCINIFHKLWKDIRWDKNKIKCFWVLNPSTFGTLVYKHTRFQRCLCLILPKLMPDDHSQNFEKVFLL